MTDSPSFHFSIKQLLLGTAVFGVCLGAILKVPALIGVYLLVVFLQACRMLVGRQWNSPKEMVMLALVVIGMLAFACLLLLPDVQ